MKESRFLVCFLIGCLFLCLWTPMPVEATTCVSGDHEYEVKILEYAEPEKDGLREYTCIHCGNQYKEIIPRTGHQYGNYHVEQEATCREEGVMSRECIACGYREYQLIPYTNAHQYGEWQVEQSPTCIAVGKRVRYCIYCQTKEQEEIPATGIHIYHSSISKEASCMEEGILHYECEVCGDFYEESIVATGHQWGERTIIKEPTEGETGVAAYICANDSKHIKEEAIPALVKEEIKEIKEAEEDTFNQWDIILSVLNVSSLGLFVFFIRRDLYVIKWDRE